MEYGISNQLIFFLPFLILGQCLSHYSDKNSALPAPNLPFFEGEKQQWPPIARREGGSKETQVSVSLTPPAEVSVGEYESTLKTESYASNRKVDSEDKKIRIHVAASTNIFGTTLLVLLLVGILTGVVVFGIRLSKK